MCWKSVTVYLKLESNTQQIWNQNNRLSGADKVLSAFCYVVSDIRKVSLPISHLTPEYNICIIYANKRISITSQEQIFISYPYKDI
jgi:hypothetical protein